MKYTRNVHQARERLRALNAQITGAYLAARAAGTSADTGALDRVFDEEAWFCVNKKALQVRLGDTLPRMNLGNFIDVDTGELPEEVVRIVNRYARQTGKYFIVYEDNDKCRIRVHCVTEELWCEYEYHRGPLEEIERKA